MPQLSRTEKQVTDIPLVDMRKRSLYQLIGKGKEIVVATLDDPLAGLSTDNCQRRSLRRMRSKSLI